MSAVGLGGEGMSACGLCRPHACCGFTKQLYCSEALSCTHPDITGL